jgi:hypothetical protein
MSKTGEIVTFSNFCKKRAKKQFSTKKSTSYKGDFVPTLVADVLQSGGNGLDQISLTDGTHDAVKPQVFRGFDVG